MKGGLLFFYFSFFTLFSEVEGSTGKVMHPLLENTDSLAAWQAYAKGLAFEKEGKPDSAVNYYEKAALLYKQQNLSDRYIRAEKKQGDMLFAQRKNEQAIQFYHDFFARNKSLLKNEAELSQDAYYKLGFSYARKALFIDALKWLHVSEGLQQKIYGPEDERMVPTYENIGRLYFVSGRFGEAITYHKKYLELNRKFNGAAHLSVASAYNYLGLSYSHLADHQTALDYYGKAVQIILNSDSATKEPLMHLNSNIGLVHGRMGAHEKALAYVEEALAIRLELAGDKDAYAAEYYNNLGRIYTDMGSYAVAVNYLKKSLEQKLQEVGPSHSSTANTYSNLGGAYLKMKEYSQAMNCYDSALQIYRKSFRNKGDQVATTLQAISKVYFEQGDFSAALNVVQEAIKAVVPGFNEEDVYKNPALEDEILHKLSLIRILDQKGQILEKRYEEFGQEEDIAAAYRAYLLAQQFTRQVHRGLLDVDSKMFLANDAHKLYEKTIRTGLKYQHISGDRTVPDEILSVMEQNKSKLLLQSLQYSQRKNKISMPDSLLKKERSLYSDLAYYKKQLYEEQAKEQPDSSKLETLNNNIFETKRAQEEWLTYLEKEVPKYYHLKFNSKPLTINEVQEKLLDNNSQLLEFFAGDSTLYILQLTRRRVNMHSIDMTSDLHAKTLLMLEGLKEHDFKQYTQYAHELYRLLLAQALALAPDKKQLIIIPDGIFGYLPFEVLLTQAAEEGERYRSLSYLLKNYSVSYHYSSSLMVFNSETKSENEGSNNAFVGFAPDFKSKANPLLATRAAADVALASTLTQLPEAQKEVKAIAGLWNGKSLLGAEATEEMFRQLSGTAGIIHLATHAIVNDENPMYSRLVFSSPQNNSADDGLLHTYELYNMNLKADLVCLSACNTGTGKLNKGEGIMSLARGFMYAGVPNVLMSLWSVPDESTSKLMQYFYEAMRKGNSKEESLRMAKLRYLREADDNTANPYYWGAFVYLGNAREEQTNWRTILPWLGVVLLLAGVTYGVYTHRLF